MYDNSALEPYEKRGLDKLFPPKPLDTLPLEVDAQKV